MNQFAEQPDIMEAWEKRDYVLLASRLEGFAQATTRTVMERLAIPLENDTLELFEGFAKKAALATAIANTVANWHRMAPMLGN